MPLTQKQVLNVLETTYVPGIKKLLLSLGRVDNIEVVGNTVNISLRLTPIDEENITKLKEVLANRLTLLGASDVNIDITFKTTPKIKHIIAIGSGKGGVGKSTVATNLAASLAHKGFKVGLMDADIYGPNIPEMFGIAQNLPEVTSDSKMIPLEKYGVKIMSIGFLLENSSTPIIWRGPLIARAIEQFYEDVDWGELDFLLVDLPPETGDVALTVAQAIPTEYGIIVTTPQSVSVLDASKALNMFKQMNIKVLGIIENMAYFKCPHCGKITEIFSSGGGEKLAEKTGTMLLGKIPLEVEVREGADNGVPSIFLEGNSDVKTAFLNIADKLIELIGSTP